MGRRHWKTNRKLRKAIGHRQLFVWDDR